mmetsp:Transcript_43493/g.135290  ORF Transcript_43493/g.135290 Transcript_43493/m.135290 type:complete len:221 (-) Transcript_43493:417-1079(-)
MPPAKEAEEPAGPASILAELTMGADNMVWVCTGGGTMTGATAGAAAAPIAAAVAKAALEEKHCEGPAMEPALAKGFAVDGAKTVALGKAAADAAGAEPTPMVKLGMDATDAAGALPMPMVALGKEATDAAGAFPTNEEIRVEERGCWAPSTTIVALGKEAAAATAPMEADMAGTDAAEKDCAGPVIMAVLANGEETPSNPCVVGWIMVVTWGLDTGGVAA